MTRRNDNPRSVVQRWFFARVLEASWLRADNRAAGDRRVCGRGGCGPHGQLLCWRARLRSSLRVARPRGMGLVRAGSGINQEAAAAGGGARHGGDLPGKCDIAVKTLPLCRPEEQSFASETGAILRQGGQHETSARHRCEFCPPPAQSRRVRWPSSLQWSASAAALGALTLILAGCSSGSPSSSSSSTAQAAGHKGGTFTILANSAFGVADPAQNYTLEQWQLLIDTHDGLVGFAKVGGVAGTKIVPDLATSIPTPTNGGKTYVFHIRQGIKFSNGQTLKPSDFVRTFERQFTVPGPTSFYSGLVGASKCSTKGCDLSQGVVADDSAYTLTLNLTAPDPELMDQLSLPFAFAVPGNTSLKLTGNNVPPGTGPYMWQSYNPNTQAVLVRNPYFHVWNAEAQPEGYPNEIIEKYGLLGLRRGAGGAERPGQRGLRRRPDPVRPAQPAEQPAVRQPGAREHADRRLVLRAEHQAPAVQQPPGPAGDQLRGQPGGLRQDRGRFLAGRADLPDPAARTTRPTRPTARTRRDPATTRGPDPTWPRPSSWSSSPARPG